MLCLLHLIIEVIILSWKALYQTTRQTLCQVSSLSNVPNFFFGSCLNMHWSAQSCAFLASSSSHCWNEPKKEEKKTQINETERKFSTPAKFRYRRRPILVEMKIKSPYRAPAAPRCFLLTISSIFSAPGCPGMSPCATAWRNLLCSSNISYLSVGPRPDSVEERGKKATRKTRSRLEKYENCNCHN